MAAYAYTIALSPTKAVKLLGGLTVLWGTVTISNYNGTTPVEVTEITGKFRNAPVIQAGPAWSGSGNACNIWWDAVAKSFRAFVSSTGAQVADNVTSVGTFSFIAFGFG